MSWRLDELGTAKDASRAGEGMAGAGVEAHGGAAGEGDGQPFVRAGRGFESAYSAHRGGLVRGSFGVAEDEGADGFLARSSSPSALSKPEPGSFRATVISEAHSRRVCRHKRTSCSSS